MKSHNGACLSLQYMKEKKKKQAEYVFEVKMLK